MGGGCTGAERRAARGGSVDGGVIYGSVIYSVVTYSVVICSVVTYSSATHESPFTSSQGLGSSCSHAPVAHYKGAAIAESSDLSAGG
jgi:hypothetical protein